MIVNILVIIVSKAKHNACVYDDGQVSPANFLTNGSSHGNTVPESRPYEESARIPIRFDAEAPRKKLKPNTPNNERKIQRNHQTILLPIINKQLLKMKSLLR